MRDLFVFWDSSLVVLGVFLTRLACYNKIVEKTRAEICLQTTIIKKSYLFTKKKTTLLIKCFIVVCKLILLYLVMLFFNLPKKARMASFD